MRALVTGAAGFIGSTLVDRLLAEGYQVVGIDNFRTGFEENLAEAQRFGERNSGRFTLVRLDIQAPELVDILEGANPQVVFHLAARDDYGDAVADPQLDARTNVLGTINLCEASRRTGVRRIVYAASGNSRYGRQSRLADETSTLDPLSPHAVAKLAGEMYLRAYAEQYGISPICLALANVYGPRQGCHGESGIVSVVGSALITGIPFVIHHDAVDGHDFVFVDDVVDAFVRAGCAPAHLAGTYNIGTGRRTTSSEVYRLICAALDGTPVSGGIEIDDFETDHSRVLTLNWAKARQELDWRPCVDVEVGIQRTLRWLSSVLEVEGQVLASA
jgi:UDP-glucose 4-epimerase